MRAQSSLPLPQFIVDIAFSSGGETAGRSIESVIAADTTLPAIVPIPIPRPFQ